MNAIPRSSAARFGAVGVVVLWAVVSLWRSESARDAGGWPSLQTVQHVSGRPATWEDVRAERAAISFVYDDRHRGRPVDGVTVPQYAYRRHAEGRERAVLIQAEHDAEGKVIYGVREVASGAVVACIPENVTLLGAGER